MTPLYRIALVTLLAALTSGLASAQPGGSPGGGGGGGRGPARAGADMTPGWSLMTPQERTEHRDRMRAMTRLDECRAYQAEHHEQMVARAKERGVTPPAGPRRDPCAGLK